MSVAMASLAQQFMRELKNPRAWPLLLVPLFLLLVRYSFSAKRGRAKQQASDNLPPSPPALPVLGHLHHLVGSLPHVSLQSLAGKHGYGLMLLRLGSMPIVIVSSPAAAEAVLRTHDLLFASRVPSPITDIIMYGSSDIASAPYGDYWRRMRKLVTTHMLSVKRVQLLRHAREEEVSTVMDQIGEAAAAAAAVDLGDLLGSFTIDLVCRVIMGKSSSRNDGRSKLFRQLIVDTSPLLGGFNAEELFPFLARFGVLSKVVRAKSEGLRRRWDELLEPLIDDHERQYDAAAAASDQKKDEDEDFINILLSVRQEYALTREHIKAILLDVFFAGVDTAAAVLEYTVVELLQRPSVMRKLQAEVRSVVPKGQEIVSETDLNLNDIAYLRAVIKESLRLRPVAPLLPHFCLTSCSVDGFVVPAGVRVFVNIWAIGRDRRNWGEDAEEFVPERFLDGGSAADVGFKGNDFRFLPFGAGRRQCPGVNFGMASVELMLANLVHRFDWEVPAGREPRDIDMSEEFGLVMHRKEKLLLVPKLRV